MCRYDGDLVRTGKLRRECGTLLESSEVEVDRKDFLHRPAGEQRVAELASSMNSRGGESHVIIQPARQFAQWVMPLERSKDFLKSNDVCIQFVENPEGEVGREAAATGETGPPMDIIGGHAESGSRTLHGTVRGLLGYGEIRDALRHPRAKITSFDILPGSSDYLNHCREGVPRIVRFAAGPCNSCAAKSFPRPTQLRDRIEESPPSIPMTWPVTQRLAVGSSSHRIAPAMSVGSPIDPSGCIAWDLASPSPFESIA